MATVEETIDCSDARHCRSGERGLHSQPQQPRFQSGRGREHSESNVADEFF